MRLHLTTTPNPRSVPFTYQSSLVGTFHKWLGKTNMEHDQISLYSLSWLRGGKRRGTGLHFPHGAKWNISSPNSELLKKLIDGVQEDPSIAFGLEVSEVMVEHDPQFKEESKFLVQSPVLIKRSDEKGHETYYTYDHPRADEYMTETLQHKLREANLEDLSISVAFDRDYPRAKTKLADYRGIKIKGSLCPVILKGDPEAIAFAWNVGVGNSTGIGFGALR